VTERNQDFVVYGEAEDYPAWDDSCLEGSGRNPQEQRQEHQLDPAMADRSFLKAESLMEAVVERANMHAAYTRVVQNRGASGVDNMPVEAIFGYLRAHWPQIKDQLVKGVYLPQAVRRVDIPKPGGKEKRMLGIPTVLDRIIQQALSQVLTPLFDSNFSNSSYGFRLGRSAHDAVKQARTYVAEGKRWVVDIDLSKFFDRVNHDILMSRLARRIGDKHVLGLIRRYLQSGIMDNGIVSPRTEGTPQGGPLSPLLSNIILDDLDKELERRGHSFCRYADDCNIYVRTKASGERVMRSVCEFLTRKLKLVVNEAKSAVARPWERKFLGYSMTSHKQPRLKAAAASVDRLRNKLRERFRMGRGRNIKDFVGEMRPLLTGWTAYFRLAEVKGIFDELDGWIRRKLRCLIWRQCKRPKTRAKRLMKRGLGEERAWTSSYNGRGPWWNSGASHMNEAFPKSYFDRLGLVSLQQQRLRLQRAS
jgi:group II intron reverse transcriptase/maturase